MRKRTLLPSTLATRGFNTGYHDTGYPTLATHTADTGYPDTGYPTLATPDLLPLEHGNYRILPWPCVLCPADY
jgi:hypothetical protein